MSGALTRSIRGIADDLRNALGATVDAEHKSVRDPDSEHGRAFLRRALAEAEDNIEDALHRVRAIHISDAPDRPRAAAGGRD